MKINKLHIYYWNPKKDVREEITIKPETSAPVLLKLEIAKTLIPLIRKKQLEWYYVVAEVRKPDRTHGYRTIVPKTLVA